MEICLINPHYRKDIRGKYPSLGLGYIAAVLENDGYGVDYVDVDALDMTNKDLQIYLTKTNPDVVGIMCNSSNFIEAKETGQIARKSVPDAFIVVGGPHLDIYPKETVKNPEFDAGIYREGEHTILELIKTLEDDRDFCDISGLIYKKDNSVVVNSPRPPIINLDDIPFPARHLMPNDKYHSPIARAHPFTTMITSRGCPFTCFYCRPINGKTFRMRSPENVVDEIELCVDNFGVQEILFYDDTFTVNVKRVMEICDEIIDRQLDVIWDCRTRVDSVNKKLLMKMKAAGCERIRYGVEAGDQYILDIMRKGITLNQVRRAFKWAKEADIETLAYFMIGTPGENLKTIQKTIDLAKSVNSDHVRFNITTAYPGTEMYNVALERGYLDRDVWRDFTLGLITTRPNPVFEEKEYTRKDLERLIQKAYKNCLSL